MNRLLLIAIAILVLGIAASSIFLLGTHPTVEQQVDDVLKDLSEGGYEQVWSASSAEFQARYPLDGFRQQMTDFHGSMGAYQRIVTTREDEASARGQAVDGLAFELEYAQGRAFCYIVLDPDASPPRLRELLLR